MAKGRWAFDMIKKAADKAPNVSKSAKNTLTSLYSSLNKPNPSQKQNATPQPHQQQPHTFTPPPRQEGQIGRPAQKGTQAEKGRIRSLWHVSMSQGLEATQNIFNKIKQKQYTGLKSPTQQKTPSSDPQPSPLNNSSTNQSNSPNSNALKKTSVAQLARQILERAKSTANLDRLKDNQIKNAFVGIFQKIYWKIVFAFCLGMFIYGIASEIPRQVRIYLQGLSRDAMEVESKGKSRSRSQSRKKDREEEEE